MRQRLAFLGSTGAGKTTLIQALRGDPRLAANLVVDIDFFQPREELRDRETLAVRAVVGKRPDLVFGVMADPAVRALLAARGFSFAVLSLPESVHRARLAQRLESGRDRLGTDLEQSIAQQHHLQSLGFESVDATLSLEEMTRDIRNKLSKLGPDGKLAILAAPGVGKTTLSQHLRSDRRVQADSKLKKRLVLNSEPFLLEALDAERLNGLRGDSRDTYLQWAELRAVQAIIRKRVDVLLGVMSTRRRRTLLARSGFRFVVLGVPEPLHRARIEKRRRERGKVVEVPGAVKRQRKLEALGYETIDASRELSEVVEDIVSRIISPEAAATRSQPRVEGSEKVALRLARQY